MRSESPISTLAFQLAAGAAGPSPLIERSYWVVPGRFLAGAYPGSDDPAVAEARLAALLDAGVRRFLSLNEGAELGPEEGRLKPYDALLARLAAERSVAVRLLRHPVPDYGVPSRGEMEAILDEVDRALQLEEGLYLHCWGGLGRTGTVLGCWLARHGLARGEAALRAISLLRSRASNAARPSPESELQLDFVRSWPDPIQSPTFRK